MRTIKNRNNFGEMNKIVIFIIIFINILKLKLKEIYDLVLRKK